MTFYSDEDFSFIFNVCMQNEQDLPSVGTHQEILMKFIIFLVIYIFSKSHLSHFPRANMHCLAMPTAEVMVTIRPSAHERLCVRDAVKRFCVLNEPRHGVARVNG